MNPIFCLFLLFPVRHTVSVLLEVTDAFVEFLDQTGAPEFHCGNVGALLYCYGTVADEAVFQLEKRPGVVALEVDGIVRVSSCQHDPPWHLSDLQRDDGGILCDGAATLNTSIILNKQLYSLSPKAQGSGEIVYIVDTFVDTSHPEFEGRAYVGFRSNYGEHYHGTHVAALVAGRTYGSAKSALLVSVQVLDGDGQGAYSKIVDGLAWILRTKTKGIVNMSIGGPYSQITNKAVKELTSAGFPVVVAAGNDNTDACNTSPASAASAITVGAYSETQWYAGFSNWGRCVDVSAPGVAILSAIPRGRTSYLSGTSMAAPLVAGLLASYQSQYKDRRSVQGLLDFLKRGCVQGVIRGLRMDTPNLSVRQTLRDNSCKQTTTNATTTTNTENIHKNPVRLVFQRH